MTEDSEDWLDQYTELHSLMGKIIKSAERAIKDFESIAELTLEPDTKSRALAACKRLAELTE